MARLYQIRIVWEGPFRIQEVVRKKSDGGCHPKYDGEDYGLYQIYGKHILSGPETLLYVGQTTDQTFSGRFRQHFKEWLRREEGIEIYLGRVYDPLKHHEKDNWNTWEMDIKLAEQIIIYKYSPNYNNRSITNAPSLSPHKRVHLVHDGRPNKLKHKDYAPDDF